ncbi:MAG: aminoacyl-tRNA hydrolase [Proteobacteria bacterium]|nr:aminoacyl-tRNA hydrolase [Pseudomonadota bacterium]
MTMNKFKLIVGLGNFGEKYQYNRHNLGFLILDNIIYPEKFEYNGKNNSYIFKKNGIIFAKPKSFMNTSGDEVLKLASFFQIKPEEILVIHDDIDLEFGKIKFQVGSSDAGHNGVKDIIRALGTRDFYRLRFGVGRPENNLVPVDSFVLSDFLPHEIEVINKFDLNQYLNSHL